MDHVTGNSEQGQAQQGNPDKPDSSAVSNAQAEQNSKAPEECKAERNTESTNGESSFVQRMNGPDWVTAIATVMISLATVVYVYYARRQWQAMSGQLTAMNKQLFEMKKQTDYTWQQLVGTEAAVLDPTVDLTGNNELHVSIINHGRVTATDVHLKIALSKRNLRNDALIGAAVRFEPPVRPLPPERGFDKVWTLPWRLSDFQKSTGDRWIDGWPWTTTFAFQEELTYKNGFGQMISVSICRKWLPAFEITYQGRSMSGGGLYDCGEIDTTISSTLKLESDAEHADKKSD